MLLKCFGVFPACAGVIPALLRIHMGAFSLSRMRGGDPAETGPALGLVRSFPHTRGDPMAGFR